MYYTLENIDRHWQSNHGDFVRLYADWVEAYRILIPLTGEVIRLLQGRKALAENCTHLLLSKAFNHTLATYTLIPCGLLIDAGLSARNGLETLLLLELLMTDSSERHFNDWALGKEFRPGWVRQQLGTNLSTTVRDVVITFNDDYYETVKIAYSFFSDITHANLRSAEHSVKGDHTTQLIVPTAGHLDEKEALINCLLAVLGNGLHRCSIIASAVFDPGFLKSHGTEFTEAQRRMHTAMTAHLGSSVPPEAGRASRCSGACPARLVDGSATPLCGPADPEHSASVGSARARPA